MKIKITLPDGSAREYSKGISAGEIALDIGKRLGQDALAARINSKLKDLSDPINEDSALQIVTFDDKEGKEVFWHSTSHLMTQAVLRIFKGQNIGLGVGMPIDNGFYQDYDIESLTEDDLRKIENEMQKIVKENLEISHKDVPKKEAYTFYKKDPYKTQFINEIPDEKVRMYTQGEFDNLCKGPHVPNTSYIKAFKLTSIAGAYWKGDSKNKMLTRIYGISFYDKKDLDAYLKMMEEAEKRDHRKIGKQLDLFSIHEEGPGFVFFHPKGVIIINELMEFSRKLQEKNGYKEIRTPIILNRKLWEQSGHWDHYRDAMYFTKIDEQDFAVKPMNCPGCILIYKESFHSYKEFPLRLQEFGLVHRHELSGVLSGLFRVRSFIQDDAHIFVMPPQIRNEVVKVIELTDYLYKKFGFEYHVELSTKPEKAMGDLDIWQKAEQSLKEALNAKKLEYKINEGGGAFYGPKIDFHIKDCIGRTWQCATIQVDFQMPEKFDLNYIGEDNAKHRPVIIHRTLYGSIERFFGILIEHFAGKFPLWLAPIQLRILTVADRFENYANKLKEEFEKNNLRIEVDSRTESVGYKVREAQAQKIPLILTVGEKEENNNTVAVRTLDNKVYFDVKTNEFLEKVLKNIEGKQVKVEL